MSAESGNRGSEVAHEVVGDWYLRATELSETVERLRELVRDAPDCLGTRQALHNDWLNRASRELGETL